MHQVCNLGLYSHGSTLDYYTYEIQQKKQGHAGESKIKDLPKGSL